MPTKSRNTDRHIQNADFMLLAADDKTKPPGSERVYFIKLSTKPHWIMLKGPSSRRYYKEWYDYIRYTALRTDNLKRLAAVMGTDQTRKWGQELVGSVLSGKIKTPTTSASDMREVTKTTPSQRRYRSGFLICRQTRDGLHHWTEDIGPLWREYLCLLLLVLLRTR